MDSRTHAYRLIVTRHRRIGRRSSPSGPHLARTKTTLLCRFAIAVPCAGSRVNAGGTAALWERPSQVLPDIPSQEVLGLLP